ncbi:hypothetical protein ACTXT7_014639 [Hymenolepis weldensis]
MEAPTPVLRITRAQGIIQHERTSKSQTALEVAVAAKSSLPRTFILLGLRFNQYSWLFRPSAVPLIDIEPKTSDIPCENISYAQALERKFYKEQNLLKRDIR